jgi:hypothetical protein
MDTWIRENCHIWVIPTRDCWTDVSSGKKYPTFWVFDSFDAFEGMKHNRAAIGRNYALYARLYRTDIPLDELETFYNKNEPVPLCWDESFSDENIDDMVGKFLQFCNDEDIILTKSQHNISLHIRRWLREQDRIMPLSSPDVDRLVSRVVAIQTREYQQTEPPQVQNCACGRIFRCLSDLQSHFMAIDAVMMGERSSSYRTKAEVESAKQKHPGWIVGQWSRRLGVQ